MLETVEFVQRYTREALITAASGKNGAFASLASGSGNLLAGSYAVLEPLAGQDVFTVAMRAGGWTGGGVLYVDVAPDTASVDDGVAGWITIQGYSLVDGSVVTSLGAANLIIAQYPIVGMGKVRVRFSGTLTTGGATLTLIAGKVQSPLGANSGAIPNPLPVTGPLTMAQLLAAEPLGVTISGQPVSVLGPLTDAQLAARLPLSVRDVPLTTSGAITTGSGVNGVLSVLTSTALNANSSLSLALNGEETLTVAMTQGTWAGGGTFYCDVSPDGGTNWITKTLYTQGGSLGGVLGTLVYASTVLQSARVDVAGMTHARIRASGTITPSVNPTFTLVAVRGNPLEGVATKAPCSTPATSNVASNAGNVTLLASNPARLGATITNAALSGNLYIKMGATATTTTGYHAKLVPGAYWELPFRYTGQIDGIWDTADGNGANMCELTA